MPTVFYHRQGGCFWNVCLSVCLSACDQHISKTGGRIWRKFCLQAPFRPRTNWLTFEPDPDHSPDPGSGFSTWFRTFARYLKDFKSHFDKTWHAGKARLTDVRRPSVGLRWRAYSRIKDLKSPIKGNRPSVPTRD